MPEAVGLALTELVGEMEERGVGVGGAHRVTGVDRVHARGCDRPGVG